MGCFRAARGGSMNMFDLDRASSGRLTGSSGNCRSPRGPSPCLLTTPGSMEWGQSNASARSATASSNQGTFGDACL